MSLTLFWRTLKTRLMNWWRKSLIYFRSWIIWQARLFCTADVRIEAPNFYSHLKYSPERTLAGWKASSSKIFKACISTYILEANGFLSVEWTSLSDEYNYKALRFRFVAGLYLCWRCKLSLKLCFWEMELLNIFILRGKIKW